MLFHTTESECVGALICILRSVLFPHCSRQVDNNLQIYNRQICWRARASWKAAIPRAASYFTNYDEGYIAPSLNIHETPLHVYARGTNRTFSHRFWFSPCFAERVNFTRKIWRSTGIIISVCAFQYLYSLQVIRFNLIWELSPFFIIVTHFLNCHRENNKIKVSQLLILKLKIIFICLSATKYLIFSHRFLYAVFRGNFNEF